jgi:peptidoglycan hydrolase-like protein with peptidoglycan-binding domain
MPVTKTGPYRWKVTTDEKHVIIVDSILISCEWEKSAAYTGQKVFYLIYTSFVGHGSPITVRCKTSSGTTLADEVNLVYDNYLRDSFDLPADLEEGETIYLEVESIKKNLYGTSKPIPVYRRPYVENMKWSKDEAERGDIVTLTADVYNVADHTSALVQIYECGYDDAHEIITKIPKEVIKGRVELMWEYRGFPNDRYAEYRKWAKEQGLDWEQPKYFFTVTVGTTEYGKENQDSGFLKIFVEGTASAHILEFDDSLFCKSSAVLLPDRIDSNPLDTGKKNIITGLSTIKKLLLFADANKSKKLFSAGHVNRSEGGTDAYDLSLKRAESIRCLVENDRQKWVSLCNECHTVEDLQHILAWAGYYSGKFDGIDGVKTKAALKAFQRDAGLKDDGVAGSKTFGAFFDKYQQSLESMMADDNAKRALKNRGNLVWAYSKKAVGCGSLFTKNYVDKDNLKNRTDSWVEVLFFDPIDIPDFVCKDGGCTAGDCLVYKPRLVERAYIGPDQTCLSKEFIQFQLYSESGELYVKKAYTTQINDVEDTQNTDERAWTLPINVSGVKEGLISYEGLKYSFKVEETEPSEMIRAKSALNGLGYATGELNDEKTDTFECVVKQYQAMTELKQTGNVDKDTLDNLKKEHVHLFGPES